MGLLSNIGNFIDRAGTRLRLPEFGISEAFAQGPTQNTYNYQANQGNLAGPVNPNYYAQGGRPPGQVLSAGTSPTPGFDTNIGNVTFGNPVGGGGGGGAASYPGQAASGMSFDQWQRDQAYVAQQRADAERVAREQQAALLSSLNTEYDRNTEALNQQLGTLGSQRQSSMEALNQEFDRVKSQTEQSRTKSAESRDKSIQQAGSIAKSTQQQNRNVLRALGILNSSAGGDLLSKPINEFDRQRGELVQAYNQRSSELDEFLNQQASQHSLAVKQIEQQYTDLVGKIQSDLRFNDRQRVDAVKSANAALQSRLAEIQQSMMQYQQQVDLQKQQFGTQVQKMMSYQNPGVNTQALQATAFSTPEAQRQTLGIASSSPDEIRRRQQQAFLSGLG